MARAGFVNGEGWVSFRGEQIPRAAAKFEHALPGADEEAIDLFQAAVIPGSHTAPAFALAGDDIPVGLARLCEFLSR